ncbi:hypothetical protein [Paraglaciecola marina]|uniref:hypothetical protein n=1 Tax=Paraglaciecola marina TaxID=2500157 RepID=UPI00105F4507|nr:hypothetical protein [Paraglaciecola marina]
MASDLTKQFDVSRQTPSGQSIEELRQNYFIEASMKGDDSASIGGLQVNTNGRKDAAALALRRQQQATNDILLLSELSRQLDAISDSMRQKYGQHFADDFAAQFLDEETCKKLAQIKDPKEREKATAKAINDGIKDGSIDPADVYANPDFKQWLDKHEEVAATQRDNDIKLASNRTAELAPERSDISEHDITASELDNALAGFNLT